MKFEQGFRRTPVGPKTPETTRIALEQDIKESSVYDFERLSPALQHAVTERVDRILEQTPLDKRYVSKIFNLDKQYIAPEELNYFQAYGRLAIRQLVLGDFFGEEEPIQEESKVLHELMERPLGGVSSGPREYEDIHLAKSFGRGSDLVHDIAHTWVDLAESNDMEDPSNMVPKFLRYKKSLKTNEALAEASAHDEDIVSFYNVDGYRNQSGILKSIQKAKSREEFLDHDYLIKEPLTKTEPTPFKKQVRGRMYDEYKTNPNLLFDIFVETTLPVMGKYAPEEVAALETLHTSPFARYL